MYSLKKERMMKKKFQNGYLKEIRIQQKLGGYKLWLTNKKYYVYSSLHIKGV